MKFQLFGAFALGGLVAFSTVAQGQYYGANAPSVAPMPPAPPPLPRPPAPPAPVVPPQLHTGYPEPNQPQRYSAQAVGGGGSGWSCNSMRVCTRRYNAWAYSVPGWFAGWYMNECRKLSQGGNHEASPYSYAGQIPGSTTVVCQVTEITRPYM